MSEKDENEVSITFFANEKFYQLLCGLAYITEKDIANVIRDGAVLLDMAVKAELKGELLEVGGKQIKVLP